MPDLNAATYEFTNDSGIEIPSPESGVSYELADPYPSTIEVPALPAALITSVRIKITGFTHSWPSDVDIAVEAPPENPLEKGRWCPVISDAGNNNDAVDLNLVFDDNAETVVPEIGQITSGSYRPANYQNFENDAYYERNDIDPSKICQSGKLNELAQTGVSGTWKLFVADDQNLDSGSMASWSVIIETMPGPLIEARRNHTATLLLNGKVLIAGGFNDGVLASAELYDPSSGSSSATGALGTARRNHTATLLPNGRVLVAGGHNGTALNSAEVYNPVSGTWGDVGNLGEARSEHTAVLLENGLVLVAGGFDASGDNTLSSSELYDPVSRSWNATNGSLLISHANHSANLLSDGRVLIAGGYSTTYDQPVVTAEIFDPASGQWSLAGGNLSIPRQGHTATLLRNGDVLVAGGINGNGNLAGTEVYGWNTGIWTTGGSLGTARREHTATLLPNGDVMVVGGDTRDAEIYDGESGTWGRQAVASARRNHTATLLPGGQILIAGGSLNGVTADTELLGYHDFDEFGGMGVGPIPDGDNGYGNPLDISFDAAGTYGGVSAIEVDFAADHAWVGDLKATLIAPDDTQHLLFERTGLTLNSEFGIGSELNSSNTLTFRDSSMNNWWTWAQSGDPVPSGNARTVVAGGDGIMNPPEVTSLNSAFSDVPPDGSWTLRFEDAVGGDSGMVTAAKLRMTPVYNLNARYQWTPTGNTATGFANHTATLMPDGRVLVAGGYNPDGEGEFGIANAEIYTPAGFARLELGSPEISPDTEQADPDEGFWSETGFLNQKRHSHTATLLLDGKILVVGGKDQSSDALGTTELYDPALASWNFAGSLSVARFDHTATLLPDGRVLVVGGRGSPGTISSSELYNPDSGTWNAADELSTRRRQHSATLMPNGKVLVVGGFDGSDWLSSAEIFDPADNEGAGSWSAAADFGGELSRHSATLLGSGKVLVSGGHPLDGVFNARIYDPSTDSWKTSGKLINDRSGKALAILLQNGLVLVATRKMAEDNITRYYTSETFDPATESWRTGPAAPVPWDGAATFTLLPSGKVLLTGGNLIAPSTSAHLFGTESEAPPAWRPSISNARINAQNQLLISGTGFTANTSASGGAGSQDSPTGYPLVQWRQLSNQRTVFLQSLASRPYSSTTFVSRPLTIDPGYGLVTLFVNGIPSEGYIVNFEGIPVIDPDLLFEDGFETPPSELQ